MRIRCPECGKLNNITRTVEAGTILKCGYCKSEHLTLHAITAKMIIDDLGQLNDISKELANTVANVYFRFLNLSIYQSNPYAAPPNIANSPNLMKSFKSYADLTARTISDYETIKDSIKALRNIDKFTKPNLYQYTVDFILDCYKYDIKNAHKKRGIRRMVERKFKRVNEISNLIDLLVDVYPS